MDTDHRTYDHALRAAIVDAAWAILELHRLGWPLERAIQHERGRSCFGWRSWDRVLHLVQVHLGD